MANDNVAEAKPKKQKAKLQRNCPMKTCPLSMQPVCLIWPMGQPVKTPTAQITCTAFAILICKPFGGRSGPQILKEMSV